MKKTLLFGALAFACMSPAAAQTVYDTTAPFVGDWQPFGVPNTATYGQTFTVGSDNLLNGFSLYLDDTPASPIDFKGYIYAWDGSKATGSALYSSDVRTFAGTTFGNPEEFAFDTGTLALASGTQYVAFLTTSGLQGGAQDGLARMPYSGQYGTDPLPGGNFVYLNNGDNFGALFTNSWNQPNDGDVWFKAMFNQATGAVPEPSTWLMLILGFGVVGGAMRSRRKVQVTFA